MSTDQGFEEDTGVNDAALDADVPIDKQAVEPVEPVDNPVGVDELQGEIARLRRHNDKLLAEKKAAKSELTEVEELRERLVNLEEAKASAEAEAVLSRRVAQLAGRVTAPEKALLLLEDAHVGADGLIDVEKFLADNPMFQLAKGGPAPVASGGKTPEALDMNSLIRLRSGR